MELSHKLRGSVQLDHEDALLALLEAGLTMKPRKVHKDTLSVFDVILGSQDPQMSHLTYIEDPSSEDCTVSVTEDPIDEAWPALPAQPSLLEDLPQPAPIYLWGQTW